MFLWSFGALQLSYAIRIRDRRGILIDRHRVRNEDYTMAPAKGFLKDPCLCLVIVAYAKKVDPRILVSVRSNILVYAQCKCKISSLE